MIFTINEKRYNIYIDGDVYIMMSKENEIKIFSLMAGIEEPWVLEKVEVDENKDLHMYVKYKRGEKFKCNQCQELCQVHDTIDKTWRHLNCFEHKTYIHCKVPRIKCEKHGVHLVEVPWAKANTGFTLLFEEFVMQLAKKMSILSISKLLNESNGRLWRIVHRYANEYVENLEFSKVTKIGLDETSRKGHEYITVFIDLDTSRVLYIADGKKASTIEEFKQFFIQHNGNPEKVTDITCDMSMGFTTGIKKAFKNSKIIYDKFHVMKVINEALDKVRKSEVSEQPILKRTRYLWLKNQNNLKEEQQENIERMSKMNLKTGKAYRLKLAFQDIYNMNYSIQIAEGEFKEWIQWAIRSKLPEFKSAAKTIGSKLSGILNYFENKLTNAVLEGTNSMIQSIKSRARGYKKIENFKAMIYLMNSEHGIVG